MQCKNCGTANEPDGKFCKECGQKLESAEPRSLKPSEHIKIGELIYAAYKHKEAGEIESAILACQGALALNASSAPAHALLASLYESKGDIMAAIGEYQQVLRLNPDSEADRRKLEKLKSGLLDVPGPSQPAPSGPLARLLPYWPYAAAFASFCIVIILFLLITGNGNNQAQGTGEQQTQAAVPNTQQATPGQPYWQPPYPVPNYQNPVQPMPSQNQGQAAQGRTPSGQTPQQPRDGSSRPGAGSDGGAQPSLNPIPPVTPTMPRDASASGGDSGSSPVITPITEGNGGTPPVTRPTPTTATNPTTRPSTTPPSAPKPTGDPAERARQLQSSGKYEEAITAYKESLSRTTDPGYTHQQIALCYQRAGQKDQAVEYYTRAINSYRDQLRVGRDPSEVQRNIRTCEAGIQVSRR